MSPSDFQILSPHAVERAGLALSRTPRERNLCLLLAALTLIVYVQVWRFDFVRLDDPKYIANNRHILGGVAVDGIRWAFGTFYDGNWHPLTWLSLMLDASLFGRRPGGYHITNVTLHVANVLLVFALFSEMTRSRGPSAFVAALFAVHPLHVESVAWVSERKDVLSMLFALLSMRAYVQYAQEPRVARIGLSWLYFLGSLLSKQTFVTLPLVFLLLDYWPLGRLSGAAPPDRLKEVPAASVPCQTHPAQACRMRLIVEKLPFVAVSGVFCLVAVLAQSRNQFIQSLQNVPLATRCLNAISAYGLYLWKALFPVNLSSFYPHPGARLSMTGLAISSVFLSATTLFAIVNAPRRPYILVGWLWYLVSLLPMIGLIQIGPQRMADRYVYFPLLGVYMAVAWLIPDLVPVTHGRRLLPIVAVGIVGVLAAIAFVQVGYWRDSVTLYRHSLAAAEDNSQARIRLGTALLVQGRVDEAMTHLRQAVQMEPDSAQAHFALGGGFLVLSRWDEAADEFRSAVACEPAFAAGHGNLGFVLHKQRRYTAAEQELDRALEIDQNYVPAYVDRALLCNDLGRYDVAIVSSQRALELDPTLPVCHRLIATALRGQGRLDAAIKELQRAVAISPEDGETQAQLARFLAMKGSHGHAVRP